MLCVLVLIMMLARVDAVNNTVRCPAGCNCEMPYSYFISLYSADMHVDCGHGHPNANEEHLSLELDSTLSAERFVEHLTSLRITNTPLTRVPASVCKLVNLSSLNLDNNKLTELPGKCFSKLTKLMTLSVKWNSIVGLQDGLFDGLQSLATLDLSHNRIVFIGLRVFSNSSDMTSLRSLNLSYNRLTSLEPWGYYRCILGDEASRVTIDLQSNLISNFTNKLKFEYKCGTKRPYCYVNLNYNRITHIMDAVNGWNLGGFLSSLYCLLNKNSPVSSNSMKFSFATGYHGGTYECDCTDFPIYRIVNYFPGSNILEVYAVLISTPSILVSTEKNTSLQSL